jgi:enamine deaminase RidA (YjgF/YER057c/UK114 family)
LLKKQRSAAQRQRVDLIHLPENDPRYHMPYTPAIKVHGGALVFVAGVTAAPVYHSHPQVPQEFAGIPTDAVAQTEQALENLRRVLDAAGRFRRRRADLPLHQRTRIATRMRSTP